MPSLRCASRSPTRTRALLSASLLSAVCTLAVATGAHAQTRVLMAHAGAPAVAMNAAGRYMIVVPTTDQTGPFAVFSGVSPSLSGAAVRVGGALSGLAAPAISPRGDPLLAFGDQATQSPDLIVRALRGLSGVPQALGAPHGVYVGDSLAVGFSPRGRGWIAWATDDVPSSIMVASQPRAGARFSAPRRVFTEPSAASLGDPQIAFDAGGRPTLSWDRGVVACEPIQAQAWAQSGRCRDVNQEVYVTVQAPSGRFAAPQAMGAGCSGDQLSEGPSGAAALVMSCNGPHADNWLRYAERPAGGRFGAARWLVDQPGGDFLPSVLLTPRGEIIVAFVHHRGTTYNFVEAARVELVTGRLGHPLGRPRGVTAYANQEDAPQLLLGGRGRAYLTFCTSGAERLAVAAIERGTRLGPRKVLSGPHVGGGVVAPASGPALAVWTTRVGRVVADTFVLPR